MQPYFFPYAGYYRLLAVADEFVVFDTAQFPRRGRVHRCALADASGAIQWLTLPLARAAREVAIRDLAFAEGARTSLDERLARHPWLARPNGALGARLHALLHDALPQPVDFLVAGLRLVAEGLGLPARISRSSDLSIPADLKGQDRIIALARALNATSYVNAPGGRHLYDPAAFKRSGLRLRFLDDYAGRYPEMLRALYTADPAALRRDILEQSRLRTAD